MHDSVGVGMAQGIADGDADLDDPPVREPPRRQRALKRGAAHELGYEVGALVIGGRLIEGDDPGMREARRGVGLALEAALRHELAREDLDRNIALQALVARHPHGPKAARAQAPAQAVALKDDRGL